MRPQYLVVEDHAIVASALARLLAKFGDATVVGTVEDATRLLAERRTWSAFFIDVTLPDGSGLDVLARARTLYPGTPALVLTGDTTPATINGAHDLQADLIIKPLDPRRLERFLQTSAQSVAARLRCAIAVWTMTHALSDAEADVLLRAARGERRDQIAEARGASKLTVKNQIASLLNKTGDDALHLAVERLLRETASR